MHLIMNALEEVTSRAHPNVSEISLLITLVSASAGFEPAKKKNKTTKSRKLSWPTTVLITPLEFLPFRMIQVLLLAPSEEVVYTSQLPPCILTVVIGMENNALAALYPSGHT